MRPLEVAIRDHLIDFLAGTATLDEFKDWLVGATWGVDDAASPEARQLANAVELALAEESSGFLTLKELHTDLRDLLDRASVNVQV